MPGADRWRHAPARPRAITSERGNVMSLHYRVMRREPRLPSGPGDLFGLTEGGKGVIALVVVLGVLVALIWGFTAVSSTSSDPVHEALIRLRARP